MRDETVIDGLAEVTLDERWNTEPRHNHWYAASTQFATSNLGIGQGRSCLVIGSPVFEAVALRALGGDVTYMDVRQPPPAAGKNVVCDAVNMVADDESYDAVSSACVLTHAGTGRYGDGLAVENGDELMLGHIARVMKKGAKAALTFGACISADKPIRLGQRHRIYTIEEGVRMLNAAKLEIEDIKVWSALSKEWTESEPTTDINNPDYLSFMVWK